MEFFDPDKAIMLGARVLVKVEIPADELEKQIENAGLVVPEAIKLKKEFKIAKAEMGEVVMVGDAVDSDWAKPGDTIMIPKTGGYDKQSEDGTAYRIIMEEDIIMRKKREGE